MKVYDDLELKANYFMEMLKEMNVYNFEDCIVFYSNGHEFSRQNHLISLKNAECFQDNDNPIFYPAIFSENPKERNNIQKYKSLYYRYEVPKELLTTDDCLKLINFINKYKTFGFYTFYNSIPKKINENLQHLFLNNYLTNLFKDQNEGSKQREYLDEDTFLLLKIGENKFVLPHQHQELLENVCNILN
uniref:Uncharacterized protein n=1 Tax=Meloidogyne enterolobii TaxID=390850 RepID=A0A6V7WI12_MELEN|nr:unnamed protein product [Meloidogyne enterolobii]